MPAIFSKNFKKISSLLIVLILYSVFVTAGSVSPTDIASDTGIITLTIVNRPPVITNLHLSPDTAFEDTILECIPIINDERTDEVKLIYKWYINNVFVETSGSSLAGFDKNDLVRCEVTPIDNEGVFGGTKSVSITINKKPALSAVTGFVVKNYNISILPVFNSLLSII